MEIFLSKLKLFSYVN